VLHCCISGSIGPIGGAKIYFMQKLTLSKVIIVLLLVSLGIFFLLTSTSEPKVLPRDISPVTGVKIVAFGDSLTAGYGLEVTDSYPALLEVALKNRGHLVTVINEGVNGETTAENLKRASDIRSLKPDLVLLGIGGNDALRLLPVAEARNNIKETLRILQGGENPPVVVLLRMQAPITSGLGYKKEFDAMYEEISNSHEVILVPFLTADIFLKNEYKLSDRIHLNKLGYQKVVELYLVEKIEQIIRQMTS